jgi:hypothetical protein
MRQIADDSCRSYGHNFDMWDNPACSQGSRNSASQKGWWWRCQINCYTPPPPVTCTKKGPDGPIYEEPAPTPDIVSSKQHCADQLSACQIKVDEVTSHQNTLTNTQTVTDTTTKGNSVTIGVNSEFQCVHHHYAISIPNESNQPTSSASPTRRVSISHMPLPQVSTSQGQIPKG